MAPRIGRVHRGADRQVALHALAAQVEVAVAQADDLVDVVGAVVDRERRRLGRATGSRRCSRPPRPRRWRGCGLTVPSGRARTVPVMRTTYSLRRSWAPSTTHWTMPVWSRRSTNARCSPCSRRRADPAAHARPSAPTCSARSSPHMWVRMLMARTVQHLRCTCVDDASRGRPSSCLASVMQVADGDGAVCGLLLADDQRERARRTGRPASSATFMRAAVEGAVGADAGGAQLGVSVERVRRRPATSTTNTSTRRRGRREHALGVAGQQDALDAGAEADARRRRAAELLDEPVVAAAAADRRSAASSSDVALELERRVRVVVEARARGAASSSKSMPSARRPGLHPLEVGDGASSERWSTMRGASASDRARLPRASSRAPAAGATSSVWRRLRRAGRRARSSSHACSTSRYAARSAGVAQRVERAGATAAGRARAGSRAPQGDHLDVDVGVGRADALDADLVVLAVAAGLRRARSGSSARRTRPSTASSGGARRRPARPTPCPRGAARACRPPLSSKSYISLRTTSVPSPTRWNTSMSSNIGDWIRRSRRPDEGRTRQQRLPAGRSGGRMSARPRGCLELGRRGEAPCQGPGAQIAFRVRPPRHEKRRHLITFVAHRHHPRRHPRPRRARWAAAPSTVVRHSRHRDDHAGALARRGGPRRCRSRTSCAAAAAAWSPAPRLRARSSTPSASCTSGQPWTGILEFHVEHRAESRSRSRCHPGRQRPRGCSSSARPSPPRGCSRQLVAARRERHTDTGRLLIHPGGPSQLRRQRQPLRTN